MKLLRRDALLIKTGDTKSPLYAKIQEGLFVRPVRIGARAVAWPEHEVDAIIKARVSGATNEAIKRLVTKLHELRANATTAFVQ